MASNALALPSPDNIAQALQSSAELIEQIVGDAGDSEMVKQLKQQLRRSAANVRLLFELQADPESGEFRLQNYGQAWMLADLLIQAEMVPSSYETDFKDGRGKQIDPAKVVIGLMKATEIGIGPISGLANIMIINNRPSVWGALAQALVQRTGLITNHSAVEIGSRPAPGLELTRWSDDYGWRVSFSRKGQETPYEREYTVAQAKRARLWGNTNKKPWISDPDQMLFNRARARAINDGFSDCLYGMGIIEEQRDFEGEVGSSRAIAGPAPTPSGDDDEPVTQIEHQQPIEQPDYENRKAPEPVEAKAEETPSSPEGTLPLD